MSIELLSRAWKAEASSPSAKLILMRLVDFCDDEGRRIFPTVGRLAREAQCSTRTAQRVLKEFLAIGLLHRVREGGLKPGQATCYEMDLGVLDRLAREGWQAVAGAAPLAGTGDHGDEPDDETGDEHAIGHAENAGETPVEPCANRGDTVSPMPEGCHHVTRTGDTLSPNPLRGIPQGSEREGARARGEGETSPETAPPVATGGAGVSFEAFRKAWPTAAADSQSQMLAAWGDLSAEQQRAALDGIAPFLDELRRLGRKHVISGVVYLRERRWTLIEGLKREAKATELVTAKPWSRLWWAVFHAARAGKLRRDDGAATHPKFVLNLAQRSTAGWRLREAEAAALMPETLVGVPARGDAARAFVARCGREGVHFDGFGADQWIFLPPGEAAAISTEGLA